MKARLPWSLLVSGNALVSGDFVGVDHAPASEAAHHFILTGLGHRKQPSERPSIP